MERCALTWEADCLLLQLKTAIHFTGPYVRSASVERKAYVYSCGDGWGARGKAEVVAGSVDELRIALDII